MIDRTGSRALERRKASSRSLSSPLLICPTVRWSTRASTTPESRVSIAYSPFLPPVLWTPDLACVPARLYVPTSLSLSLRRVREVGTRAQRETGRNTGKNRPQPGAKPVAACDRLRDRPGSQSLTPYRWQSTRQTQTRSAAWFVPVPEDVLRPSRSTSRPAKRGQI